MVFEPEKYTEKFDEYLNDRRRVKNDIQSLLVKNIEHLRQFNSSLLTVAVGLIGAVMAAFSTNTEIITIPSLAVSGIFFLFVDILLIVFVNDAVLISENEKLEKQSAFFEKTNDEMLDLITKSVQQRLPIEEFNKLELSKLEDFSNKEKDFRKDNEFTKNKYLRIIDYLFILSLILIFGSIIVR